MFRLLLVSFVILFVHFCVVNCEPSTRIKDQIETYKEFVNASLFLEKQDRLLMSNWTEEMQVKQVNITSRFRLQMTRHKEHSFRKRNSNHKWTECMNLHNIEIKRTETQYYENEADCLKLANNDDRDKRGAVSQIEKEIRKWRKSYKYLTKLCNTENPDVAGDAEVCLVEYMQRDNFNIAIQRLLILKLDAMQDLLQSLDSNIGNLEECLTLQLSEFLGNVRGLMDVLNTCYRRNYKSELHE